MDNKFQMPIPATKGVPLTLLPSYFPPADIDVKPIVIHNKMGIFIYPDDLRNPRYKSNFTGVRGNDSALRRQTAKFLPKHVGKKKKKGILSLLSCGCH